MDNLEESHVGLWDFVVIILYGIFIIVVGIWSSRKNKKGSISSYFLASRKMHFIPVGASLFASCIGAGHFIGLAGSGAASGIAVAGFELGAVFILMLLGWFFVPVYLSSGIYTMPEYLRERFGGQRIRVYLAFLSLILYIFTKISADLYAGALFIQMALNKNSAEWLYISILILLGISALFTIAGGLTAVIWTDLIQTIFMILGAFILMGKAFYEVGGFNALITKYPDAIAKNRTLGSTCGEPPKDYLNLLRTIEPGKSDYPWTGIVFGLTINAIWYWCTDQVIVQRTLASKNFSHAKGGCIFAAYIKLMPLWLMIFSGMASRILFPDRVGCATPEECMKICGSPGGCTNIAYVELIIKLLPQGLTGMMLATMMAALLSSLTSIFNSASTIFTIDIWTRFRKNPSDVELIVVGRVSVIIIVVISVLWIPVIQLQLDVRGVSSSSVVMTGNASPSARQILDAINNICDIPDRDAAIHDDLFNDIDFNELILFHPTTTTENSMDDFLSSSEMADFLIMHETPISHPSSTLILSSSPTQSTSSAYISNHPSAMSSVSLPMRHVSLYKDNNRDQQQQAQTNDDSSENYIGSCLWDRESDRTKETPINTNIHIDHLVKTSILDNQEPDIFDDSFEMWIDACIWDDVSDKPKCSTPIKKTQTSLKRKLDSTQEVDIVPKRRRTDPTKSCYKERLKRTINDVIERYCKTGSAIDDTIDRVVRGQLS